ncbi:MAG: glycine cleavage system protein H [Candidatus Marinimicrobia bacterium]|nr:glycine cleavage system protein H [Candidatus Neomarinimicrobiota bacterium]
MSDSTQLKFPADRYYHSSNHMWAKETDENGEILVGIDALALDSLGEIAYASFVEINTEVKAGDSIGTLESAKMTTEIFSPISGVVSAVNDIVPETPLLINEQPYGEGWLVVIRASAWEAECADLISGEEIFEWSQNEIARYETENNQN